MCPKDAHSLANIVDPHQTAPLVYSYFMPVWGIVYNYYRHFWATVKTIAPRCCGCTIAWGHKAEGHSASGRPQHWGGDSFHYCPKKVCDSCFITQPGGVFFFIVHRFLFNLTCSCSCIPEFNSRRVTFSIIMQCLHMIFEKLGSSSIC